MTNNIELEGRAIDNQINRKRVVKKIPVHHYQEINYQEITTANVYLFLNQYVEWVDTKGKNTPYKVTII